MMSTISQQVHQYTYRSTAQRDVYEIPIYIFFRLTLTLRAYLPAVLFSERCLQNTYLRFLLIDTYCSCLFDVGLCLLSVVSERPTMVGIITYFRLLPNLPLQSYRNTNNNNDTLYFQHLKHRTRTKK